MFLKFILHCDIVIMVHMLIYRTEINQQKKEPSIFTQEWVVLFLCV